jgi:predicted Zn-dependent peptidase
MISIVNKEINNSFEKGPIRRSLFSNGAVSLFHQFKGLEGAVVNIYFLAGSVFEKEEEYGISHVIEHMLFKEGEGQETIKELEYSGAEINAYTYKEHVCFEMTCSAKKLKRFFPKYLSLFLNPHFNEKALELEKKVIIQELKEDGDDHETFGLEYLYKKNFSPALGHSIGGTIKNVRNFKTDQLYKYYKKWYTSDRMIVSIVSGHSYNNFEIDLEQVLNTYLKDKKLRPKRLSIKKSFSKLQHISNKLKRKMESSIVFYSFNGYSVHHPDYYNLLVLDDLLFEGMSSVFFDILREKHGLVYGMGSAINSYAKEGSYIMVFNTKGSNIKFLDQCIKETLENIALGGDHLEQTEIIVERIKEAWKLAFDNIAERCEYFAEVEMFAENDFSLQKIIAKLNQVTDDSLQKTLNKILKSNNSRLILGK